jgi:hypothetical protein
MTSMRLALSPGLFRQPGPGWAVVYADRFSYHIDGVFLAHSQAEVRWRALCMAGKAHVRIVPWGNTPLRSALKPA